MQVGDFDAMMALNVRGVFLCTRQALPFMEAQRSGTIVHVASLAGRNAFVNGAGYAATKWALIGFARCLMLEEREFNIRVLTICPGSVETSFSPRSADAGDHDWILQPEDVSTAVLGALMLPERAMVSEIDIRPTRPR
jgi:3-oxoacyl-[acyl-carrier protein] reductase